MEPIAHLVRPIDMSNKRGLELFDVYAAEQRRYWAVLRDGLDLSLKDERAILASEVARYSPPKTGYPPISGRQGHAKHRQAPWETMSPSEEDE